MKRSILLATCMLAVISIFKTFGADNSKIKPWDNGALKVSDNGSYFQHENGTLKYIGEYSDNVTPFQYDGAHGAGNDIVLIVVDASKDYIGKDWNRILD